MNDTCTHGKVDKEQFVPIDFAIPADLEGHQQEFLSREAFAYTVVSPDESRVVGCVYINPAREEGIDARIRMWVRESEYIKGLDPVLFGAVKAWIEKEWPFETVSYPERE